MGANIAALAASPVQTPPPLPSGTGTSTSSTGTILKNVAMYGTIGAAVGFGASFLSLPVVGQVAAPITAAIGGAIGALIGFFVGRSKVHDNDDAPLPPSLPAVDGARVLSAQPVTAKLVSRIVAPVALDSVRDHILSRFDRNGDSSIVLTDEVSGLASRTGLITVADMNHDGTVTREEINDTLANADTDDDGKLAMSEARSFVAARKHDADDA